MNLEDFFEKKKRYYHTQNTKNYYHGDSNNYIPYHNKQEKFNLFELLNSVRHNKKLKIIILVILIIFVAIIIGLIALIFPLIGNIINYIAQNGVSGIVEMVMDSLNKLWNGAK